MERTRLAELIAFDERRRAKHRVFETDRTLTDLYCLDPGQEQLLHVHEGSDKVLVVMAGRALGRVDHATGEARPNESVLAAARLRPGPDRDPPAPGQHEASPAPAASKHPLKNLGPDPAVLLLFVGPRL